MLRRTALNRFTNIIHFLVQCDVRFYGSVRRYDSVRIHAAVDPRGLPC